MLWFRVPEKTYFKYGCLPIALQELADMGKKKAFIVTDRVLFDMGYTNKVTDVLDANGIQYKIFSDVEPDPTLRCARAGAAEMTNFQPDVIISLGGGSAMDAAKIMWVMYEHPEVNFHDLAMTFMDIRKRIYKFPTMGQKAMMVAIATSAGTGSEVTPFAVITDEETGVKYPLADYELTPDMAIVDAELMMTSPKGLTACAGIVFMKSSQPFYQAYEVAEGLCKQAKMYSRQYKQVTDDSSSPVIPSSLAFYKITDSLIEEVDMMIETSMSVSTHQAIYHLSVPAYMVDEIDGNDTKVPSLRQLEQLNSILSDSRINARPLRQLATLMHLNLDQATQVYKRWLQYSKRSTEQLQKVSKAEQKEVKQINLFLNTLEQVIGQLEKDLPVTRVKSTDAVTPEYQSVIGDLLTLMVVAEETTFENTQSSSLNKEGA